MSAVTEYGGHLRSHTAILKSMSDASATLAAVVVELHRTLAASKPPAERPPPPPPIPPRVPPAPLHGPARPHGRAEALLDYLRRSSYSEWSLLVPELAAAATATTPEAVIQEIVLLPGVELSYATVGDATIYRYRFI